MPRQDYHTSITVHATAQEVFKNINSISAWWSKDVDGRAEKLNDIFTVRFGETFITVKIIEFVPWKKIGWHVIDCYKHFLKDKKEWKDSSISWEISSEKNATQINFTHVGLIPGIECYTACEKAWDDYIQENLFKLVTKEKGIPELK